MRRRRPLAALALTTLGVSCGGEGNGASGDVVVFAAASLADAFTEVGAAFEDAHPGVDVTFNFAGSSELAAQITQGAPVDVFASADQDNMARLSDLASGAVFATNRAEIIVAAGNPLGIAGLGDLAGDELRVVLCAPEVPCGRYAAEIISQSRVGVTPVSLERNVRAVVTKVTLGEADAGIVYATDVIAAGDAVTGLTIPEGSNVVAEYPIAVMGDAPNTEGAGAFVEFVTGDEAQTILAEYGFGAP